MILNTDNTAYEQSLSVEQVADLISERSIGFVRYARENRFPLGVSEGLDCLRVMEIVGVTNKPQLKLALKGLMCSSAEQWERFDRLFDLYWVHNSSSGNSRVSTGGTGSRDKNSTPADSGSGGSSTNPQFDVPDPSDVQSADNAMASLSQQGASATETLAQTHFNQLNHAAELREMEELAKNLARKIRRKLLRRLKTASKGRRIDMRRTMRASLQHGGEPVSLSYRKRRVQIPKLVLMLDVSRSMSVYSYLFLRFARGILDVFQDADAYAFHTRLQHIGEALREKRRVDLIEKMEIISRGWGGGTRIDSSLTEFNRRYARSVLDRRTVFVVVSDGYDTGEPDALVRELTKIKRQVKRIVWVNPLLGQPYYSPSTKCMQAVLPLIDVFAPGHNLASLAALEKPLATL